MSKCWENCLSNVIYARSYTPYQPEWKIKYSFSKPFSNFNPIFQKSFGWRQWERREKIKRTAPIYRFTCTRSFTFFTFVCIQFFLSYRTSTKLNPYHTAAGAAKKEKEAYKRERALKINIRLPNFFFFFFILLATPRFNQWSPITVNWLPFLT